MVARKLSKFVRKAFPSNSTVRLALRRLPPPKDLPKPALKAYMWSLQRDNEAKAREIVGSDFPVKPLGVQPLTSEQKTLLVARYLPDERDAVKALRNQAHRLMWRWFQQRQWQRYDSILEELRSRKVPFDEVTYNMCIFEALVCPKIDDQIARQILRDMVEDGKFHPSLLRLHESFLDTYFELKDVDAQPNALNLMKVAKTFWQVSVNFKQNRIREFRRRIAEAAVTLGQDQPSVTADGRLKMLTAGSNDDTQVAGDDDDPDDDFGDELHDGYGPPDPRFPLRRPKSLRNVFKGSGAPNQRPRKRRMWRLTV